MNQAIGNHAVKEFFTETEWDMIYNFIGHALDDEDYDPEQVYSIRAKIHNLFLWHFKNWHKGSCVLIRSLP